MIFTLVNNFHGTEVRLRIRYQGGTGYVHLSAGQVRRAKRTLCASDCRCSDDMGLRRESIEVASGLWLHPKRSIINPCTGAAEVFLTSSNRGGDRG